MQEGVSGVPAEIWNYASNREVASLLRTSSQFSAAITMTPRTMDKLLSGVCINNTTQNASVSIAMRGPPRKRNASASARFFRNTSSATENEQYVSNLATAERVIFHLKFPIPVKASSNTV